MQYESERDRLCVYVWGKSGKCKFWKCVKWNSGYDSIILKIWELIADLAEI